MSVNNEFCGNKINLNKLNKDHEPEKYWHLQPCYYITNEENFNNLVDANQQIKCISWNKTQNLLAAGISSTKSTSNGKFC